ncbi:MAG: peptide chain release factor 2 [Firmicutes bacterium]|nr:peptide chain release factor 2 [Bacillota bacterium]
MFDLAGLEKEAAELEAKMAEPDFWNDAARAGKVSQQLKAVQDKIKTWKQVEQAASDLEVLLELAEEDPESGLGEEIRRTYSSLKKQVDRLDLEMMLSGEYDGHNAILTIHPGAGGTEAQDWAQMLMRMYTRWAEDKGFKVQILDMLPGEEAGIKSVTLSIEGPNAYGFLRSEKGVHRLVRISPFDASGRRHTSFASVDVMPEIETDEEVEIDPNDLRVDTYRASGAGGQHVNKTDSAVRITHIPTGIVVQCQSERSQISNRETAMKMLRARLAERKLEEQEKKLAEIRGEQSEIAWGSQIRSYVFCPYTMVKDHRTNVETGNVDAVMDGDLDDFIEAYLRSQSMRKH